MNEEDRSGFSDEDWDKWIKSREPTHDDYAWEDEEPPISQVGDLVRENEGRPHGWARHKSIQERI